MDRFSTHDAKDRDITLEMLKRVFIVAEIVAKKLRPDEAIQNHNQFSEKHENKKSI